VFATFEPLLDPADRSSPVADLVNGCSHDEARPYGFPFCPWCGAEVDPAAAPSGARNPVGAASANPEPAGDGAPASPAGEGPPCLPPRGRAALAWAQFIAHGVELGVLRALYASLDDAGKFYPQDADREIRDLETTDQETGEVLEGSADATA
jgi:hypothetical protein